MRKSLDEKLPYSPVSIVIPILNNLSWTKQCLESIFNTNKRECEIIVIDNASTDNSVEYLEEVQKTHPELRVIKNTQNIGVAPAWNQGIKESKFDYICIINNDIKFLSSDWLCRLQSTIRNGKNVLWTSPKTCYSLEKREIYNVSHYEQLLYSKNNRYEYVVACCFMCPKTTFDTIGFFDEKFEVKYYEDLDFIARILSSGNRVKMTNDVLVYHGVGKTSRITSGGANNENYYQSKWKGTPYDILAMQPDRGKSGTVHFDSDGKKIIK